MQRRGALRLAAQIPMGINKGTIFHNSPSSSPHLHHENIDDQIFFILLESCKLSLDMKTAIETHARIIRFGYGTHPAITASLISVFMKSGRLNLAYQVIHQLFSWTVDLVTLNLVIRNSMRVGEYEVAEKVFNKMPDGDVVTWNSMIGGYVRNARYEEALRSFKTMVSSNFEPDKFTFASVMTVRARLGALDYAHWVHDLMVQKRIELNFILSSALIDIYSKCGRIQTAKEIFNSVRRSDVSIWNSMINGLAVHGLAFDAIMVFSKMDVENVLPDSITFVGILTACSHSGLVKEGRKPRPRL